jgi:exodeoxyribonuclease-3
MRIATWNINSINVRLGRLESWLAANEPDVCCLQETKSTDDAFPSLALAALGYESAHHGSGGRNGVAILSRLGLDDVRAGFTTPLSDAEDEARLISARCGGVEVVSLYVPNGQRVGSEQYAFKLAWLDHLERELRSRFDPGGALALCGDFNIAPEDRDVWDVTQFVGATHVSEPERAALHRLLDWGLSDAMRMAVPDEVGPFSWWDYRAGAFHKGWGMRIDLVLLSATLAARITSAHVDREARKKGIKTTTTPSDHAPVVVDLA